MKYCSFERILIRIALCIEHALLVKNNKIKWVEINLIFC